MRIDLLMQDTLYFRDHFPAENYNVLGCDSAIQQCESLEMWLGKGWEKGSGVELNFFEALAWLRMEDFIEYRGLKTFSRNDMDTEYTYDFAEYQDWCVDDHGNFCIDRHASSVYNLPLRIVEKLTVLGYDKQTQVEKVLEEIERYKNGK